MEKYDKPALSLEEGVKWLREHGVLISESESSHVRRFLKSETTFRLMHIVKTSGGALSFTDLRQIYFFDRQLRNVFLEAFEIIEVQLRNSIVSALMEEPGAGAFIYESPAIFDQRFLRDHGRWLGDLKLKVEKRSQEGFVSYYKEKYKDDFPRLPIWAMVELMTFGELVDFCFNLSMLVKVKIAHNYCIDGRIFVNWLQNFSDVRNACAHHRILYNKVLNRPHKPLNPGWGDIPDNKVGVVLISLARLLTLGCGIKDRNKEFLSHWRKRIKKLIDKNKEVPSLMPGYGLPTELTGSFSVSL